MKPIKIKNVANFFVLNYSVIKIYLIGSNVTNFENRKKVLNHSTLLDMIHEKSGRFMLDLRKGVNLCHEAGWVLLSSRQRRGRTSP